MQRVSLGGEWQLKGYEGEDWNWRSAHMPDTRDVRHWFAASVPGSVHHALWQAGQLPDPYFERNSLLIEWVPDRTWVYRKSFVVGAALRSRRALLRFEGVDYEAQFFLNGRRLGHHIGMYTPAEFDVAEWLNYDGENLLAVVIERAPDEQPQVGRTSKVRTHKSRMTYWWDFCPRMIHLGIWDDIYIDFTDAVRIGDVFVHPQLDDDFARADIAIAVTLDADAAADATVEVVVRSNGEAVSKIRAARSLPSGTSTVDVSMTIDNPQLWYPNGAGAQPLYTAEVAVFPAGASRDSGQVTRQTVRFGVRRIEFIANESAAPDALPYTLVVNGQRTYIKGWNWVPMDVMYGVPRPEKLEHLLTLARQAHVNMLRIWGGGLIEKRAFYDRCDELGILVWQEFIMSSSGIDNDPPRDAEHIEMMVQEAEQIIPRRRNHPALAIWCGGNELQAGPEQPLDDSHPLLGALKAVVKRLDPGRVWLPTSPTGPAFMNSLENIARDPNGLHDVHGPWEYQGAAGQYTLYNAGTSLLHSEFGVEGITNQKTLDAVIPKEHQHPVSLDNPVWQHLGAWWLKEKMWRETFGDISDVETWVRATQLMQAEGLRYALEADRRRKYRNSGTLPWQFNEPYPMAACTSAVDYYGQPKPSYYAVKHAYEPLHVSARFDTAVWAGRDTFEAEIWVSHSNAGPKERLNHRDTAETQNAHFPSPFRDGEMKASLRARIIGSDGAVYGEWDASATIAADCAQSIFAPGLPMRDIPTDVFFLDLALSDREGRTTNRNRYSFSRTGNLAPLLRVPETTLIVQRADRHVTITNAGGHAAMFIWIEDDRDVHVAGYARQYFSDNYICLMPGESRTVTIDFPGDEPADARFSVRGWNTEEWKG